MEFREGHWANLVFVSTLGSSKTAEEIADAWDVPREKIEKDSIIREADRLKQVKFFEETGDEFLAKTDSQAFKTELEEYFDHDANENIIRSEEKLFTSIVGDLEIRKKAFDIESVTQFYGRDAMEAKKDPLAVFEGLLLAMDRVLGHEKDEDIKYNVEVLVDNLEILEKESPEALQKI